MTTITNEFVAANAVSAARLSTTSSGSHALASSVSSGSVTGLNLTAIPKLAIFTVRRPYSGLNLAATLLDGSLTTDGFSFYLTGTTDSANYKLDYVLFY